MPGTLRDSFFVLEGLLEQQTGLRPTEIMTDITGTSDMVFGLFWLLGYQFIGLQTPKNVTSACYTAVPLSTEQRGSHGLEQQSGYLSGQKTLGVAVVAIIRKIL